MTDPFEPDDWTITVTLSHPVFGEISESVTPRSLTDDGLTEAADGIAYGFEERKYALVPRELWDY